VVNKLLLVGLLAPAIAAAEVPPVEGFMWQLHEQMADARGSWHRLGARELILQWAAVDGIAYVPGLNQRPSARMPDWQRIAREPWAERVIVGLSGRMDEQTARRSLPAMLEESLAVSRLSFPFKVSGWYFPAEVDPVWKDAPKVLPPVLNKLPRPLWISVYDGEGIGAQKFAAWLVSWLPPDVNVLFQDGVGAHGRSVPDARQYAEVLAKALGKERFAVMIEAFRLENGKFRPASAAELKPQLKAFAGYRLYLFDGPHYVPERVVEELVADRTTAKARRAR
jgi:hypothetical protein